MRKASALLLAGGVALAVSGCDSFLQPDPETFSSSANYYTRPSHFEQAVVGLYADLRGQFEGNWLTLGGLRGDLVTLQYNPGVPGFTFVIDEFADDANDNNTQGLYNAVFNTIFDANVVLSRIEDVEFPDPAQKARLVAEAKFMRALAMWQGMQLWGLGEGWEPDHLAIPIIPDEITSPTQAFELQRATVQQVYDFIVQDLSGSWADLPERGSPLATGANAGRITQGAARTLLGATYQLNPADAAKALAEFQAVEAMGYDLVPDYREVFNPANKNNIESILEIQYNVNLEDGDLRLDLVPGMSPLSAAGGGNGGNAERIAVYGGSGNGSYMPTPNFVLSFAGADPSQPATPFDERYAGSIGAFCPDNGISGVTGVADVKVDNQGPNTLWPDINIDALRDPQTREVRTDCIAYFIKWRWPDQMPQAGRDNNNWIVFRFADVLLREAEALWRLDRPAEALVPLNEVRARAGLPPLSGLSGDALRDAILQERAWELGGEAWRWFDLKRFGVASEVIPQHGDFLKARNNSVSPRTRTIAEDAYTVGEGGFRLRYPNRPRDVYISHVNTHQTVGWLARGTGVAGGRGSSGEDPHRPDGPFSGCARSAAGPAASPPFHRRETLHETTRMDYPADRRRRLDDGAGAAGRRTEHHAAGGLRAGGGAEPGTGGERGGGHLRQQGTAGAGEGVQPHRHADPERERRLRAARLHRQDHHQPGADVRRAGPDRRRHRPAGHGAVPDRRRQRRLARRQRGADRALHGDDRGPRAARAAVGAGRLPLLEPRQLLQHLRRPGAGLAGARLRGGGAARGQGPARLRRPVQRRAGRGLPPQGDPEQGRRQHAAARRQPPCGVGDVRPRLPQRVRRRVQPAGRALHLRLRHGVGPRPALVPPDEHRPRDRRP
jgi:hypothetical protein